MAMKLSMWPKPVRDYWLRLSLGERYRWKLVAVITVIAGATLLAYPIAQPLLKTWRHQQALRQATRFAEQQDYRNQLLALQRATQIKPTDLTTWQRVAESLEQLGSSDAVLARENIAALAPDDVEAQLALASTALRFSQPERARAALSRVDPAAGHAETYHRLAAALALATGDERELEQQLRTLIALAPHDAEATYNLAVVELWSNDPTRERRALERLGQLTLDKNLRVRAALELLKHAARSRDSAEASAVTELLIQRLPPVSIKDPIIGGTPGWNLLAGALRSAAAQGSPTDAAAVALWLGSVRRSNEALLWLAKLPEALRETPPVREATAELAARAGELDRLRTLLTSGAWGTFPADAVNRALAARTETSPSRALALWQESIVACGANLTALRSLSRLAQLWQMPAANEAALRAFLQARPQATWAYQALRTQYLAQDERQKLLQLYENWHRHQPDNVSVVAAWIQWAAVMNKVSPTLSEKGAALPAGRDDSEKTEFAAAKAALRFSEGDYAGVRAIIDTLPPAALGHLAVQFWQTLAELSLGRIPTYPALATATPADSPLDRASQELLEQTRAKIADR